VDIVDVIVHVVGFYLPMQSVHNTTAGVSSIPAHEEVYSIQPWMMIFMTGVYRSWRGELDTTLSDKVCQCPVVREYLSWQVALYTTLSDSLSVSCSRWLSLMARCTRYNIKW